MTSFNGKSEFASPSDRRRAYWHLLLKDHGFLRLLWTHEYEIAPGVFRSNQPGPRRFERLARRGITSILSLRSPGKSIFRLEKERCCQLGLAFHHVTLPGAQPATRAQLLSLLDTFKIIEKPFVIHCKSGIDRTGFAAFLYLLAETQTSPEVARKQLSLRYLHLRKSRHGILDLMADAYLAAHKSTGIGIRGWIETDYDAEEMRARHRN